MPSIHLIESEERTGARATGKTSARERRCAFRAVARLDALFDRGPGRRPAVPVIRLTEARGEHYPEVMSICMLPQRPARVFTGLSGSGSRRLPSTRSLPRQRRYVRQSLVGLHARQFLEMHAKTPGC